MLAEISLAASINTPEISDLTTTNTDNKENLHVPIRLFKGNNGLFHHQVCSFIKEHLFFKSSFNHAIIKDNP
jgi:hypothetical protein